MRTSASVNPAMLMEAELIEPHLFLDLAPGADDRLIRSLVG